MIPIGRFAARAAATAFLASATLGPGAAAQTPGSRDPGTDWPTRPIQLVVPYGAGGGTDLIARLIAPGLGSVLGQQVVVVNKPGASSVIGTELVVNAEPDGYTVLMADTAIIVNPSLYKKLPYDTLKDLRPVAHAASAPILLVVHPSLPVTSVKDLVELAKAKPGTLSYASGGTGTQTHLSAELFKLAAKVDILHVPYKGIGPAFADVVGGQVPLTFAGVGSAAPFLASGKLKGLAVTGSQRYPSIKDVPTFDEAGVPGVDSQNDFGLWVTAKTPAPIVTKLNQAVGRVIEMPDVKARLVELGFTNAGGPPEAYGELVRRDMAKWKRVIDAARIEGS